LNVTQEELDRARKITKSSVVAYNKKLSEVNTQLGTKANIEDVNKLSGDVTGVRNDLDEAKGKLDRATGDMGVMSGLIARNHDDLEGLKQRGDRNLFRIHHPTRQGAAACWPGGYRAEQDGLEEIEVHDHGSGRRQVHRKKGPDGRRAGAILREGNGTHFAL